MLRTLRSEAALRFLVAFLPAAVVLISSSRRYLPFMADDAFISLRYADRLLEGHGLSWTDGQPVEGYSNLLWILLCAAVGTVAPLPLAARVVGVASALGAFAAIAAWGARSRARVPFALAAALALSLSSPIVVWAIGGLEQCLVMALLAVALLSIWEAPAGARRELWPAGAALAALVLTRPDSLLFVAAFAVALVMRDGLGAARAWWPVLIGAPLLAYAAQLGFRLLYYGDWVPNVARVKVAWKVARLAGGWEYVSSGWRVLVAPLGLLALGSLSVLGVPGRRRALGLLLLPPLAWLGYVVAVGGDIFPARRQLVAVVLLGVLGGVLGLAATWERGVRFRAGALFAAGAAVLLNARLTPRDQGARDARHELWEWEGEVSGRFFAEAFAAFQPTIAVDSAGCVPFFSRLPAIDMLGLNDREIPRRRGTERATGSVSFDLHDIGDADYVLSRRPDLILPCGPLGADAACDVVPWTHRLFQHREFRARYAPMSFRGLVPFQAEGTVWVRKDSPVALETTESTLTVKAPLLARS
ncbi:MAG TPA: hypothetical protein VGK73_30340, partial [Polyangiaceae bacterium]